uniref:Uncharacterized protein n=1 Tax=Arundo donax TaxID=35708 RepID=A0A0A9BNN1_ARUDO
MWTYSGGISLLGANVCFNAQVELVLILVDLRMNANKLTICMHLQFLSHVTLNRGFSVLF